MARITILIGNSDNAVYVDNRSYEDLDLSSCGVPDNLWALQWNEKGETNTGHIEYVGANTQNENITELPAWANACIAKWQEAKDAEDAAIAAMEARMAANNAPA